MEAHAAVALRSRREASEGGLSEAEKQQQIAQALSILELISVGTLHLALQEQRFHGVAMPPNKIFRVA